jgi:hypothetical protein
MAVICSHCQKGFDTQESLQQHVTAKHTQLQKEKRSYRKHFMWIILLIALFLLGYSAYTFAQKPGNYDAFAKCLTEKGAVIYGNDACQYTNKQLNFFGNSKQYLNYVKCSENRALCDQKGVRTTPTWEINGQPYPQVQTFETLAAATGCKLE